MHSELLDLIHEEEFRTERNITMKNALLAPIILGARMNELSVLLKNLINGTTYILVLFNGLSRDLFLLRQFYRWRDTYLTHLHLWIGFLAEMEVRVSKATYIFNQPQFTRPIIEDRSGILIDAKG